MERIIFRARSKLLKEMEHDSDAYRLHFILWKEERRRILETFCHYGGPCRHFRRKNGSKQTVLPQHSQEKVLTESVN